MQLSEQAKAALERLRNSTDGVVDYYAIADEMLRLFPVKTLNGVVIRWDDEITPERLVASGGKRKVHHDGRVSSVVEFGKKLWAWFTGEQTVWFSNGNEIPEIAWPTNMGEVWNLMEKCGCPLGGGE